VRWCGAWVWGAGAWPAWPSSRTLASPPPPAARFARPGASAPPGAQPAPAWHCPLRGRPGGAAGHVHGRKVGGLGWAGVAAPGGWQPPRPHTDGGGRSDSALRRPALPCLPAARPPQLLNGITFTPRPRLRWCARGGAGRGRGVPGGGGPPAPSSPLASLAAGVHLVRCAAQGRPVPPARGGDHLLPGPHRGGAQQRGRRGAAEAAGCPGRGCAAVERRPGRGGGGASAAGACAGLAGGPGGCCGGRLACLLGSSRGGEGAARVVVGGGAGLVVGAAVPQTPHASRRLRMLSHALVGARRRSRTTAWSSCSPC
jgi:hypothetical protein